MYCPPMPEKVYPIPIRRKVNIAVRPHPSIVELDKVFAPQSPAEIASRNRDNLRRLARRPQRPAVAEQPAKAVVMIAREYSPLSGNEPLRQKVSEILADLTELGSEEATRRILRAVIEPHRIRVMELSEQYHHQLSEIEERYNATAG